MHIEKTRHITAPFSAVWDVLADYGGAQPMFTGCDQCIAEGEGVGARRTLIVGGTMYRELCVQLDRARGIMSYAAIEPHPFAQIGYVAVVAVRPVDGGCIASWSCVADPPAPVGSFVELVNAGYEDALEGLEREARRRLGDNSQT